MDDFKLTFEKENISGDGSLIYYTLRFESEDGKVSCLIIDHIEYAINETDYSICKGGKYYLCYKHKEEKNISDFLKKLDKNEFPVTYNYKYEESLYYDIGSVDIELNITINQDSTTINGSKVPTSETLIKSIVAFFMDLYTQKDVVKEEVEGPSDYSDYEDEESEDESKSMP